LMTPAGRCRCSARRASSAADVARVQPLEEGAQRPGRSADLASCIGAAQQVGAETAQPLATLVYRNERRLVDQLVFARLVRSVTG
jgi:hypothetical protein